jgi:hypothetical protein
MMLWVASLRSGREKIFFIWKNFAVKALKMKRSDFMAG